MLRNPGFFLLIFCALLAGCGSGEVEQHEARLPASAPDVQDLWSVSWDSSAEDHRWNDLPEIKGLEDLAKPARVAALFVANNQKCACGCDTHNVADCINLVEGCLTAKDRAAEIVAEAQVRWAERAPSAEPTEVAEPEGAEESDPETPPVSAAPEKELIEPSPEGKLSEAEPAEPEI